MKIHARGLRKKQSDSEQFLWRCLRNQHLQGRHFRRQHPIGPYIVDLCCRKEKLVIEIDGDFHSEPENAQADAIRQAYLEGLGFRVLRFSAKEVTGNLEGVVQAIGRAITESAHAESPPP